MEKKATQHAAQRLMPLSCGLELSGSYETIMGKFKWYCLHQKRCPTCKHYRFETNPIKCRNEIYGNYPPTVLTPEKVSMLRDGLVMLYE
jgi:hypothetical protein